MGLGPATGWEEPCIRLFIQALHCNTQVIFGNDTLQNTVIGWGGSGGGGGGFRGHKHLSDFSD